MNRRSKDPYTTTGRQGLGSFAPCCSLLVALAASACGSSEDPGTPPGAAGSGPSLPDTVGRMIDDGAVCTAPNTICAKLVVPSDMVGTPRSIQFVFYDTPEAPTHPPNAYAGLFPSAQVVAGDTQKFELTDGGLQGNYWLLAIIYMPGGMPFDFPTPGVDYVQFTAVPGMVLDGTPINLEAPVVLGRAM